MTGHVSLARKNIFQDRHRALLSIVGVGAALLLVLVLDGVFAGAMQQVSAYMRNSPADVFLSQEGVRTMHMSQTSLPSDVVDDAAAIEGVEWAVGLRYTTGILDARGGQQTTYVLGYDTSSGRGGPGRLARGAPPAPGEIVVDATAADELGIDIGDPVTVLGTTFLVSGLSTDGTNIVNTTVYIRSQDFASMRGDSISYVLVGASPGVDEDELADALEASLPGTTAQTRAEFARQERNVVRGMAADVMGIMTVIAFLIAVVVVGLTLFATTLAKLREYGVVKALGAGTARLTGIVVAQAMWTIAFGLGLAVVLGIAIGAAIGALTPNVEVVIEPSSVGRTAVGAMVAALLATLVPLRRVIKVDPATTFRRPS